LVSAGGAQASEPRTLDIYFLDMVGGASTLIVTPLGESVLIDTGSMGPADRDPKRILAAANDAGLRQIDYLVTTHFHSDHFGGILEVTNRIPVRKFSDKGHLPQPDEQERDNFRLLYARYRQATEGKLETLKAGDDIPLKNDPQGQLPRLRLHCVAAQRHIEGFDGDLDAAVPGQEIRKPDLSENARSIAMVLRYGKFDLFLGGDITWNVEYRLACPKNLVGEIDLYQVTHHGLDISNNPALLKALNPTVCIAMNGPNKGIDPSAFRAMEQLPGVKAIYAIHYNTRHGERANPPLDFIANGKDPAKAQYVKVSVAPEADSFVVAIGKRGPKRTYSVK
jgi:beta-lactamase superfamily II metal-dependent hydrolase